MHPRGDCAVDVLMREARFARTIARALVGDDLADDVVQEAWLAALERGRAAIASPRGWLATVCRNGARSLLRAGQRRTRREIAVAHREAMLPDALDREATFRAVTEAVLGLDEPYRATLLARYFDDLKPREIARQANLPLATVKARLRRGLDLLRRRLDAEHADRRQPFLMGLCLLAHHTAPGTFALATAGVLALSNKLKLTLAAIAVLCAGIASLLFAPGLGDPPPDRKRAQVMAPPEAPRLAPAADATSAGTRDAAPTATEPAEPAEPPPPEATAVTELVVLTRWADGTPAAGVATQVMAWGGSHAFAHNDVGVSDGDGRTVFRGLPQGKASLYVDRGAWGSAILTVGTSVEVPIDIPIGAAYDIEVVDTDGRPAPGAQIHLSSAGHALRRSSPLCADALGHCLLRDVQPAHSVVTALLPGFVPSAATVLSASPGTRATIRLALGAPAARLRVRVIDGNRRPIASARVWVTPTSADLRALQPGGIHRYLRHEAVTDAAGTIEIDTLPDGPLEIQVRAPGYAPARSERTVAAGAFADELVHLGGGAVLTGRVTTSDGSPAADVQICVGRYGDLAAALVNTDADGNFRLTDIAPGEATLEASRHDIGKAQTVLQLIAGQQSEWHPVLDTGTELRGVVLDEHDQPVVRHLVTARESGKPPGLGWSSPGAWTDSAGRFAMRNLGGSVCDVLVTADNPSVPLKEIRGVDATAGELVIRIAAADLQSAFITGTVVDPAGTPVEAAVLVETADRSLCTAFTHATDGTFRIGPLAPGSYRLEILERSYGRQPIGTVDVVADQVRDLGMLRLAGPGRLTIDVEPVDGVNLEHVSVCVWPADEDWEGVHHPSEAARIAGPVFPATAELAPGNYDVVISGGNAIEQSTTVAVISGRTAAIRLTPCRGHSLLVLVDEQGRTDTPSVVVTVASNDGTIVSRQTVAVRVPAALRNGRSTEPSEAEVFVHHFTLREGSYRVTVEAPDGRRGEASVTADMKSFADASLVVELR